MTQRLLSILALFAALMLAATAPAQPIPVEGTDMVPNEYGDFLPREIIWQADGSRMVLVPFGTFRRGHDARAGAGPAEDPITEVYVPSFYIDKYEMTNEKYKVFHEKASGAKPVTYANKALLDPAKPVIGIPWESADRYAKWSGRELPTEAMWEKAARGPKNTLYTTGDNPPAMGQAIWGLGSYGLTADADSPTSDVSGYGIHHMNGNVAEFVQDWYQREYYEREDSRSNPTGPKEGETRVFRGASFLSRAEHLRLTLRPSVSPLLIRDEVGFRTVWVPRPVEAKPTPTPTPSPVPPPTREEITMGIVEKFLPFLEKGIPRLPREMLVSPAQLSGKTERVQFINFSPYRVSLTFIQPEQGLVYLFDEPLPEMTFRNVNLPTEQDLMIVAYAPGTARPKPFILGSVRAESGAIILVRTNLFAPVVAQNGTRRPVAEKVVPEQYYGSFSPRWNELEVFNPLGEPLIVSVEDVTVNGQPPVPIGEFTIESKEALLLVLNQGRYRFTVSYFGALGESGTPAEVRVNDRAARRLLLLAEDKQREGTVTVVTRKRPYLKFDVREANSIPR